MGRAVGQDLSQSARKIIMVDVKTENTGVDAMADSKRIISVQIGDAAKQDLYYADANVGDRSLFQAAIRIRMLIAQGCLLAGYNLKEFEVPVLKRFLALPVPSANALDLRDLEGVKKLQQETGKPFLELEEVCRECGIPVEHNRPLNEKAEALKEKPEIQAQANEAAKQLEAKGWTAASSVNYALERIATGHAVLEAYQEFVQRDGAGDSLYYKYAVGDVLCEHLLLPVLQQPTAPRPASPPI